MTELAIENSSIAELTVRGWVGVEGSVGRGRISKTLSHHGLVAKRFDSAFGLNVGLLLFIYKVAQGSKIM